MMRCLVSPEWWLSIVVGKYGVPIAIVIWLVFEFVNPVVDEMRNTMKVQAASAQQIAVSVDELTKALIVHQTNDDHFNRWLVAAIKQLCDDAHITSEIPVIPGAPKGK